MATSLRCDGIFNDHLVANLLQSTLVNNFENQSLFVAMTKLQGLCLLCILVCMRRRVLELGSGCGFLGLVICSACSPASYTFSDCHNEVLDLLVENVARNLRLTTGEFDSRCFTRSTDNHQLTSSMNFMALNGLLCADVPLRN